MTVRIETIQLPPQQAVAAVKALIAEAEAADGSSPVSDQAVIAVSQGQRQLRLFAEAEADAGAAGSAIPGSRTVVAAGVIGEGELDLVVAPTARGRGVGSAALEATLALVPDDAELLAWAHGQNSAAEALLTAAGFAPVRSLYRMELDPALLPDDGRDPLQESGSGGARLRAFDPDSPADAEAWVSANAAAFATHPEQGRITLSDFALIRKEPWFDPADLILLIDGDSGTEGGAIGSTWIKTVRAPSGEVETELYAVGVRPEHSGRGFGGLLLRSTLARMAQHDPDRVSLYVDGENERAVKLYENASFTIASRSRQWSRKPVS